LISGILKIVRPHADGSCPNFFGDFIAPLLPEKTLKKKTRPWQSIDGFRLHEGEYFKSPLLEEHIENYPIFTLKQLVIA
jgi:hypothetical protein